MSDVATTEPVIGVASTECLPAEANIRSPVDLAYDDARQSTFRGPWQGGREMMVL